jgi:hypothetical protein
MATIPAGAAPFLLQEPLGLTAFNGNRRGVARRRASRGRRVRESRKSFVPYPPKVLSELPDRLPHRAADFRNTLRPEYEHGHGRSHQEVRQTQILEHP